MDKITVGIVGGGVVGSALYHVYDRPDLNVTAKLYDIDPGRSKHSDYQVLDSDVVFLCLPTPSRDKSMELDVSAIEKFCESVAGSEGLLILKSTVPIGTTRRLSEKYKLPNLVHCPEFLTERTAMENAECPDDFLVGLTSTDLGSLPSIGTPLNNLVSRVFPNVKNPTYVSSEMSEAVKLALNASFAARVSFFNELYLLAEKLNLDYDELISTMSGSCYLFSLQHTMVPGPDGKRGFGGRCLPKDTAQFAKHLMDNGIDPVMTMGALVRCANDRQETSVPLPQEKPPTVEKQRFKIKAPLDAFTPAICRASHGTTTGDPAACLPHIVAPEEPRCQCIAVPVPSSQETPKEKS